MNLDLTATNTFTGTLVISTASAGTVNVRVASANNVIPDNVVISLSGGVNGGTGQFQLNGFNETIGGLTESGGGTRRIINNTATFVTLTINQNDDRPVTVNGTLAPGSSAGTLDLGANLTFGPNAHFALELGGTIPGDFAGSYDQVNLINTASSISLNGTATISLSLIDGFAPVASDVFYVLTRTDAGNFGTLFANAPQGGRVSLGNGMFANITYLANWTGTQETSALTGGNDVALYNVIPEPGVGSLLLGAVPFLALSRRRSQDVVTVVGK